MWEAKRDIFDNFLSDENIVQLSHHNANGKSNIVSITDLNFVIKMLTEVINAMKCICSAFAVIKANEILS